MTERSTSTWPGRDDRSVVKEMLSDSSSHYWDECHTFIQKVVQAANLPPYLKEDVVQNTMMAIVTALPNFRFTSRLTYFLYAIANNRIIDIARKHSLETRWILAPTISPEDTENEADMLKIHTLKTTEEESLIREELNEVSQEILGYLKTRFNAERDARILKLAWIGGLSHEEIACQVGVSAPVVGYVIRAAQSYLRHKMRHQSPPEDTD